MVRVGRDLRDYIVPRPLLSFHHFRQLTKPRINISARAVFRDFIALRPKFSLSKSLYTNPVK